MRTAPDETIFSKYTDARIFDIHSKRSLRIFWRLENGTFSRKGIQTYCFLCEITGYPVPSITYTEGRQTKWTHAYSVGSHLSSHHKKMLLIVRICNLSLISEYPDFQNNNANVNILPHSGTGTVGQCRKMSWWVGHEYAWNGLKVLAVSPIQYGSQWIHKAGLCLVYFEPLEEVWRTRPLVSQTVSPTGISGNRPPRPVLDTRNNEKKVWYVNVAHAPRGLLARSYS